MNDTVPRQLAASTPEAIPSLEATSENSAKLIAECDRLRRELADARKETMRLRCQAELLREEWFTAKCQEEEYRKYIKKLTGDDPSFSPREILDVEKYGLTMQQILAEVGLEPSSPSVGA